MQSLHVFIYKYLLSTFSTPAQHMRYTQKEEASGNVQGDPWHCLIRSGHRMTYEQKQKLRCTFLPFRQALMICQVMFISKKSQCKLPWSSKNAA